MKLIIAGSRTVSPDVSEINVALIEAYESGRGWPASKHAIYLDNIVEVVSGTASGADVAGEAWAEYYDKPVARFPVTNEEYAQHGRYIAPKMRNRRMAEYADAALIFWDGKSGGSADMCCRMVARGKPVRVVPMRGRK